MNAKEINTTIAAAKEEIFRLRRREDELVSLLQHRALPLLEKRAQPYNHEHRACELIRAALAGYEAPIPAEPVSVTVERVRNAMAVE